MPKATGYSPPAEESPPAGFPSGVFERNGQLYRRIVISAPDGEREQIRPVARNFEEAKAHRWDFYHSDEFGWVREGYKWEKDRSAESIIADTTQSMPVSVERQEQLRREALNEIGQEA